MFVFWLSELSGSKSLKELVKTWVNERMFGEGIGEGEGQEGEHPESEGRHDDDDDGWCWWYPVPLIST